MKTWIKQPTATWTGNELAAPDGVVVEDSIIIELVTGKPTVEVDETMDAQGCVLMPGLINCHHHFYQTLTRAFPTALDKELFEWLVSLYPVWANLDEAAIAASSKTAMCEMLLSGCTTASDHHYVFGDKAGQAIDVQVEVARELGMRAILTRGSMSLGKNEGGLPPNTVVQSPDAILRDSERLIHQYHDAGEGSMMQIALAPCSPFSVTTELMRDSAILAREKNVMLHTHLAETEDENQFCIDMFGMRPVDYLEHVGWMDNDVWLAHGIHFTADEIKRLGAAGVAVSHCPSSNMMLASGTSPVAALQEAGCPVGLGVDGSASNDCSNLAQEMRQAFLIQRLKNGASSFSHTDALALATTGGASLFHRQDIGELAPGKQADLALFSLDELRFTGAGDPLAALILCGAYQAHAVMIAGKWRVQNSELVGIDLEQVKSEQRAAASRLLANSR